MEWGKTQRNANREMPFSWSFANYNLLYDHSPSHKPWNSITRMIRAEPFHK